MRIPFWLTKNAEVIPDKAKIVQTIFDWYVKERLGVRAIASLLNEQSSPSPSNTETWQTTQVSRLIQDARVIGLSKDQKVFPEIVNPEQFREANDIIKHARNQGRRASHWSSALRGIISCHHCGSPLKVQVTDESERTLTCRNSTTGNCKNYDDIDYGLTLLFSVWECHLEIAGNVGRDKAQKKDYTPEITATQKEIDYFIELGSLAGKLREIADKLKALTSQRDKLTRLQAEQLKGTEQDSFQALIHWLYEKMPDTVEEALKGTPKESSLLNQRLHEAGQRISWDGQVLKSDKHTARRDYKRLIIEGVGTIEQSDIGTTELGGGWWFLQNPKASPKD